jgi:hypothetical protein
MATEKAMERGLETVTASGITTENTARKEECALPYKLQAPLLTVVTLTEGYCLRIPFSFTYVTYSLQTALIPP